MLVDNIEIYLKKKKDKKCQYGREQCKILPKNEKQR